MAAAATKGADMNDSIFLALNWAAEIYGRAPLSRHAAALHYKASGTDDEKAFKQRLLELVKTSPTFPLPADFRMAQANPAPTPDQAVLA